MSILSGGKRLAPSENGYEDEEDADERSERWLISYADLITTLMVFFLALYVLQLAKYRELESKAFDAHVVKQRAAVAGMDAASAVQNARTTAKQTLLSLLKPLSDQHQIAVVDTSEGVEIAINAKVLFNSGDARLLPDSFAVLNQVARALASRSAKSILVEGHSDSVPISNAKYESNWELSSARAGAVVRYFVDQGIEPLRLAAIGRADNVPLVLGDDAAARAANRRVTILVQY
ncbi:OmpA family protein [Trinickia fusca]|uniref:Motility protein B n=1 Tax=Trinickia fusca TaxID=2419777 RepID=A0A494X080_9BURK|nr:OmpA family protein [Trinickia fusca]RKP43712.1 motility protein B [Trinickia fusca]